jgi:YidC/Oxa1 family membrane protein insertase
MIAELFTTFIYQPFFNILVFFYWVLGLVSEGEPDMGIAVILLTILIRILLLPMSLAGDKSEADRRQIGKKIKELEATFAHDPIAFRQHKKLVLRQSRGVVVGEIVSLIIQVAISLMLWRIFARGLEGEDLHLLYSFMPKVEEPFNLVFLGKFDLAHASVFLNLFQSLCIFVLETLAIYTSPYPPEKGEVVRLQLILPVVSFFVFMFLPAGKKLFIITTLLISILLTLYKYVKHRFEAYKLKAEEEQAAHSEGDQKLVVDMK